MGLSRESVLTSGVVLKRGSTVYNTGWPDFIRDIPLKEVARLGIP